MPTLKTKDGELEFSTARIVRMADLSLLKNIFCLGRGWALIAAEDFHHPRGKSGDSCDLSAMHGNSANQRV